MRTVRLDPYLFETLMADIVGHDRSPAAYLVYLYLSTRAGVDRKVRMSYQDLAIETGLSRSAIQRGVAHLLKRKLLASFQAYLTDTPTYTILTPWIR